MVPAAFDQENLVLDPPPGMSPDECDSLTVFYGIIKTEENPDKEHHAVISCWKVTAEELAEINRTGRVWLIMHGRGMPPVSLSGISPWKT